MKIMWKTFLVVSAYWAGVFGWFYIGVWQVLKKPVHSVILAQIAGHLSIGLLIGAFIQGFGLHHYRSALFYRHHHYEYPLCHFSKCNCRCYKCYSFLRSLPGRILMS